MEEILRAELPGLGFAPEEEQVKRLCDFARAVLRKNEVMNLTAITDPAEVARLHLLDSLTVAAAADLSGKSLIDVGCGAGFPGVPLAICCPTARVTLLDSLGKRIRFLEETLPELGITNAECLAARAEEAVADRREQYDCAVSRAVARLNILLELLAPYVKVGGLVIAMKGAAADEELAECAGAMKKLGLRLEDKKRYPIAGAAHTVLLLRKIAPTPPRYPRRYAKIKQAPL